MSKASEVSDLADRIIQDVLKGVGMLRITRVDLNYSFLYHDLESIKAKLERAGFIISINSQCEGNYNITISYMRNWGE